MGERVKIQNKLPIPYVRTAQGVVDLAERIKEMNREGYLSLEATVDWRPWQVAEFLWSSLDDNQL